MDIKLNLLAMFLLFSFAISGTAQDPYEIRFKSINKGIVRMDSLRGKQILIAIFDASNPDTTFLRSLDTLYRRQEGRLAVIAIPTIDIRTGFLSKDIKAMLRDNLSLSYIVADLGYGKKTRGASQHLLLRWATNKAFNSHFDQDVKQDAEIYIANRMGLLYGKLSKRVPVTGSTMQQILSMDPIIL